MKPRFVAPSTTHSYSHQTPWITSTEYSPHYQPISRSFSPGEKASGAKKGGARRFGRWLQFLQILSLLLLLFAVGFLTWIWMCPRDNLNWRRLMLGPYAVRVITLTAVLVRFAISSLASVTTAMIASVALEGSGVPLYQLPRLSIARFTNTGPEALLGSIFTSSTFDVLLRPFILILFLCSLASQFTSTILLSDIDTSSVVSFSSPLAVNYTFSQFDETGPNGPVRYNGVPYWKIQPSSFESFAEYTDPSQQVVSDIVDDTGPTWRAFLPIADSGTRDSIETYNGIARIHDFRTTCTRPTITSVEPCDSHFVDSVQNFCGEGTIEADLPGDYIQFGSGSNFTFHCSILYHQDQAPISYGLCEATSNMRIMSSLNPMRAHLDTLREPQKTARSDSGYIVIGMPDENRSSGSPVISNSGWGEFFSDPLVPPTSTGPWVPFEFNVKQGANMSVVNKFVGIMTYCINPMIGTAIPVKHLNISATGASEKLLPSLTWNHGEGRYNLTSIQTQLGATKKRFTTADRGILSIDRDDLYANLDKILSLSLDNDEGFGNDTTSFMEIAVSPPVGVTVGFCAACPPTDDVMVSSVFLESLVRDIIQETGSPARAMQAVNTVMMRQVYYTYASTFSVPSMAETTFFVSVSTPVRLLGYGSVIGIISIQLILYAIALRAFYTTRYSLLNNSWQVVSQVAETAEAKALLSKAQYGISDSDVRSMVKSGYNTDDKRGLSRRFILSENGFMVKRNTDRIRRA